MLLLDVLACLRELVRSLRACQIVVFQQRNFRLVQLVCIYCHPRDIESFQEHFRVECLEL